MQRIGVRACANIVAYSECVWTIAPQLKARYSSRCVGVSDDGRSLLSTASPVSSETSTILSGVRSCVRHAARLDRKDAGVAIGDRQVAERADDEAR